MKSTRKRKRPSSETVIVIRKKKSQISAKKKEVPKPPKPKKKKKKVQALKVKALPKKEPVIEKPKPKPPKRSYVDNIPKFFKKSVYKHIDALLPPKKPWAVGIKKQLLEIMLNLPEYQGKRTQVRRLINYKLKLKCNEIEYLEALANGDIRYGFDGRVQRIDPVHKQTAKIYLEKKLARKSKQTDNLRKVANGYSKADR